MLSLNKKTQLKYSFYYITFLLLLPLASHAQKRGAPPANTQTQAPIGFQANDFDLQDSTDLLQDSILQVVLDTSDAIIPKPFNPFQNVLY